MATKNFTLPVTGAWVQVSGNTDTPLLISSATAARIEVGTSNTTTAPSVVGHEITVGVGSAPLVLTDIAQYVFARYRSGSTAVTLVVDGSSV
jgi:hypothetical protein